MAKDKIFWSYIDSGDKERFLGELANLGFDIEYGHGKKKLGGESVVYKIRLGKRSSFPGYRALEYEKSFSNSPSIQGLVKIAENYGRIQPSTRGDAGLATKKEFEEIKKYMKSCLHYSNSLTKSLNIDSIEVFLSSCYGNKNRLAVDALLSYSPPNDPGRELLEANAYVSSTLAVKGDEITCGRLPMSYRKLRVLRNSIYHPSHCCLNSFDESRSSFKELTEQFSMLVHALEFEMSALGGYYIQREFTAGILKPDFVLLGIAGGDSSSTRACRERIHNERWLDLLPPERVRTVLFDASQRRLIGVVKGLDERKICILEKENLGEILHFPYLKGYYSEIAPFYFKEQLELTNSQY